MFLLEGRLTDPPLRFFGFLELMDVITTSIVLGGIQIHFRQFTRLRLQGLTKVPYTRLLYLHILIIHKHNGAVQAKQLSILCMLKIDDCLHELKRRPP